jgi:Cu(I)/Ag(I) efflux system membrane fusion protein
MLTDAQINEIENSGTVKNNFDVVSNTTGIITARRVNNGDHIAEGTVLYDVADLSNVWVMFDAYESDLPFISKGNKLDFTVQALPGKTFTGKIIFIDPVIDPVTRVSKVRVEISNASGKLKPEMFANGVVNANLAEYSNKMIIPRSAVLWTGKRSIVYVKQPGQDESIFKIREIELGPVLGNSYVVMNGLNEGEEIVTQGTFSVDAAAQLEGKPSMMNTPSAEHHNDSMPAALKPQSSTEHSRHNIAAITEHETFAVSGNCELCKDRIEKAAKSVRGVNAALWNSRTKKMQVDFNRMETDPVTIQKAIAKAGHDAGKIKADNTAYTNLPECCKYRK